jgi:hypothetical protein
VCPVPAPPTGSADGGAGTVTGSASPAATAPTVQLSRDAPADAGVPAANVRSPRDGPRAPPAPVISQAPVTPVPPPPPPPVAPLPAPAPAGPVGPTGPSGHGGSSTTVSSGGGGHGHDTHWLVAGLAGDALGASAAPGSARFGSGPDRSPAGTAENPGARPD